MQMLLSKQSSVVTQLLPHIFLEIAALSIDVNASPHITALMQT